MRIVAFGTCGDHDCDDMANIMLIPCFRPRVDKPEDSCPRNVVDVGIPNVVLWP